jgi:hypothetical protein
MRIHLRVALACVLLAAAPAIARGQARPASLFASDSSATVTSVVNLKAESPFVWIPAAAQAVVQDTARVSRKKEPSFIMHVGFGLLAGLVIGGALGVHGDLNCQDCMFPATPYYAAVGAGLGGLIGLTIWNLRTDP